MLLRLADDGNYVAETILNKYFNLTKDRKYIRQNPKSSFHSFPPVTDYPDGFTRGFI